MIILTSLCGLYFVKIKMLYFVKKDSFFFGSVLNFSGMGNKQTSNTASFKCICLYKHRYWQWREEPISEMIVTYWDYV